MVRAAPSDPEDAVVSDEFDCGAASVPGAWEAESEADEALPELPHPPNMETDRKPFGYFQKTALIFGENIKKPVSKFNFSAFTSVSIA